MLVQTGLAYASGWEMTPPGGFISARSLFDSFRIYDEAQGVPNSGYRVMPPSTNNV